MSRARATRVGVALLVAGCLTALCLALIAGAGPWSGRVLLSVTSTHGVHEGDLPVIAVWLLGLVGCGYLGRSRPES